MLIHFAGLSSCLGRAFKDRVFKITQFETALRQRTRNNPLKKTSLLSLLKAKGLVCTAHSNYSSSGIRISLCPDRHSKSTSRHPQGSVSLCDAPSINAPSPSSLASHQHPFNMQQLWPFQHLPPQSPFRFSPACLPSPSLFFPRF